MSSTGNILSAVSDRSLHYHGRAKYAIKKDGSKVLLSTEFASHPIFVRSGFVRVEDKDGKPNIFEDFEQYSEKSAQDIARYKARALGRAKVKAFDFIMCNEDLNAFVTLTFDKNCVDRTNYDDIYDILKNWLSNRVQRRDLKYIIAPEYHHDGEAIHLHAICNEAALRYDRAHSPNGYPLRRKGKPIYNLSDWSYGFSTMQLIEKDDPREAVAKYIFKYMGKQAGALIGGRYFLHGGNLEKPYYEYTDDISYITDEIPKYSVNMQVTENLIYWKNTYL